MLLIDDEPDIRAVARMSLELVGGWQVLEADRAAVGVALAASEQPDAILLDVMMPVTDGPATLLLLRDEPRTRDIPVLLLTARGETGASPGWLAVGARGVLTKPFDPMTLPRSIAEALGWEL